MSLSQKFCKRYNFHACDTYAVERYCENKLIRCAKEGFYHQVGFFLQYVDNVNCKDDENGYTPLHWAVAKGHVAIVCLMLAKSALANRSIDVNTKNNSDETPLLTASRNISPESDQIISLLLDHNADVNVSDKNGITSLHHACRIGNSQTIQLLIRKGAGINSRDRHGWTPLRYACYYEHRHAIDILIANGASINILTIKASTPTEREDDNELETPEKLLIDASMDQDHIQAQLLLQHTHVNVNCTDESACGYRPLHWAVDVGFRWSGDHDAAFDFVKLLLESRNSINASKCFKEEDTKHRALIPSNNELLQRKNFDVNAADASGVTPLYLACEVKGNLRTVQLLLDHNADIRSKTIAGETLLHNAGDREIVNFLLERGLDINSLSNTGVTPLHRAAEKGNLEVVQALVENGAFIIMKTNEGKTPLDVANENEVVDFLRIHLKNQAYAWFKVYGKKMHLRSDAFYWLMYSWNNSYDPKQVQGRIKSSSKVSE